MTWMTTGTTALIAMALFSMEVPAVAETGNQNGAAPGAAVATFGGGCFWCMEAIFEELDGVEEVISGFAGGSARNPSYRQVCEGNTGHAEVVQVRFDPKVIGYAELLSVFFGTHDPTTPGRQGADVGSQYRSIILYHDLSQRAEAENMIGELEKEGVWPDPIVTEVEPFEAFYPADSHHQDYFAHNSEQPYCRVVISPKLEKFRKRFSEKLGGSR